MKLSYNLIWVLVKLPHRSDSKESVCNAETLVQSLGWEDPLEKEMATHSSTLAWRILWTAEPLGLRRKSWTCSIQFSHLVVSDSLWPHELQHARPPCPSPTPGVHPNSCPLSQWYHPNHLILCHSLLLPSIFPSIRVFSNELGLRGQSIGVSASTSVLAMNTQDWSPLGWTGWISL